MNQAIKFDVNVIKRGDIGYKLYDIYLPTIVNFFLSAILFFSKRVKLYLMFGHYEPKYITFVATAFSLLADFLLTAGLPRFQLAPDSLHRRSNSFWYAAANAGAFFTSSTFSALRCAALAV